MFPAGHVARRTANLRQIVARFGDFAKMPAPVMEPAR
jgi:nitrogen fixation/metabolism regulation signal transduction histidine kinase